GTGGAGRRARGRARAPARPCRSRARPRRKSRAESTAAPSAGACGWFQGLGAPSYGPRLRRCSRHSTWAYALVLSSDPRGRKRWPIANGGHTHRRGCRCSLPPAEPSFVARVELRRMRGAVAMDDRRERAPGGVEAGGHVTVSLRIGRKLARCEQLVESLRRL